MPHCFLPLPPSFHLDKEVADEEEEIDDDDIDDAAEDIKADDASADDDIDYATMPPKAYSNSEGCPQEGECRCRCSLPPQPPPPLPPPRPPSPSMQETPSRPITTPKECVTTPTNFFASTVRCRRVSI